MEARVRWNGKMGFVGISGTNHTVVMDTSPEHGEMEQRLALWRWS